MSMLSLKCGQAWISLDLIVPDDEPAVISKVVLVVPSA